MATHSPCDSYPRLPSASSEPTLGIALASLAVLVGAIALVTWAGEASVPLDPPPACVAGGQVTSAQIDAASLKVRTAQAAATRAAQNGSPYAAAKLGLPASGAEYDQAVAAAVRLKAAQAELMQLCAAAG